jgi:hypothetical protein
VPAEGAVIRRHGHLWLLLPAAALASLWLAWRALAWVDFLYPVFYPLLDIQGHIEEFGPQNRYKTGFETTTPAEHQRLFAAIVTAIHESGRGLEAVTYHDPAGRPIDTLLREPEIGHLRDVARLIDAIAPVGWLAAAWSLLHLGLLGWRRWPVPRLRRLLGASLVATIVVVLVVLVIGARRVFYWLHDLVFPPDHPWFFFYQESLMTTLMKAPDLFGAIAAALLLLGLALYAGLLWLATRLSRPA